MIVAASFLHHRIEARVISLLCRLFLATLLSLSAEAKEYTVEIRGQLDRVVDGDTIRIKGHDQAFRLYGIDATELRQPCLRRQGGEDQPVNYGLQVTNYLKGEVLADKLDTVVCHSPCLMLLFTSGYFWISPVIRMPYVA